MALRLQLVILASAFVADNTRCSTCPVICKSGDTSRALWFRTHCLGYGPSVMVRGQVMWETEVPQFGPGTKKALVWGLVPPRSQLFVKMGARAPVPYGVGATVSDILI